MARVLKTCHPNTNVDAKGQLKRENVMATKYDSLTKNKTWN